MSYRLRRGMHGRGMYGRGMVGFGDFVPTLCDPMDVACVTKNSAASVAYQQQQLEAQAGSFHDNCIANGTDPATCDARWPSGYAGNIPFLNLSPDQQAAEMATPTQAAAQMLANPYVAQELRQFQLNPALLLPTQYNVVDEYGPRSTSPAYVQPPLPAVMVAPKVSMPGTPAPTTPQGQTIINSSGVNQPVALPLPTIGGFNLSSIPWWGWAGAAAFGLYAMKGGK